MPLMQGLVLHLDKQFWEKANINNSSPNPNLIYSKLNSYFQLQFSDINFVNL